MRKTQQIENEMTLYHGTTSESVDSICKNGFNRSFCGKNGRLCSHEIYFN